MNVLSRSPRADITISINPEFELRLDHWSIQENVPTAADFAGNRIEIGHARFSIFSEVGEITTGCLLFVEYAMADHTTAAAPWHLVVVPRPAFEPLAEAMGKLVMAEGEEAIRRHALR
jgi:hypothetical protein